MLQNNVKMLFEFDKIELLNEDVARFDTYVELIQFWSDSLL